MYGHVPASCGAYGGYLDPWCWVEDDGSCATQKMEEIDSESLAWVWCDTAINYIIFLYLIMSGHNFFFIKCNFFCFVSL